MENRKIRIKLKLRNKRPRFNTLDPELSFEDILEDMKDRMDLRKSDQYELCSKDHTLRVKIIQFKVNFSQLNRFILEEKVIHFKGKIISFLG